MEREALARDLESLPDEKWDTPSLCAGWSVREVLGHMTATAEATTVSFFTQLVASGFRFGAMNEKGVAKEMAGAPADTLARFKAQSASTSHPPGPVDSWLGEVVLHAEDIRRPLGMTHEYSADAVIRVADFYKRSNLIIGAKKRIEGLCLKATDADWSTGSGPEVTGPALSLLLAMAGRSVGLEGLSGEGLSTLAART